MMEALKNPGTGIHYNTKTQLERKQTFVFIKILLIKIWMGIHHHLRSVFIVVVLIAPGRDQLISSVQVLLS